MSVSGWNHREKASSDLAEMAYGDRISNARRQIPYSDRLALIRRLRSQESVLGNPCHCTIGAIRDRRRLDALRLRWNPRPLRRVEPTTGICRVMTSVSTLEVPCISALRP